MFGKCKHKKISEVQADGYQYCLGCNKAIYAAPMRPEHRCNHEHLSGIQSDGYQYCEHCNTAILAAVKPKPKENVCKHKWERISSQNYGTTSRTLYTIFIYRCEHCGIEHRQTSADKDWEFPS